MTDLILALVGPTGSGKSTLAKELASEHGFNVVAPGEMLREHIENRSALGLMARQHIEMNALVPDEIVNAMIEEFLSHNKAEGLILFEGFPRTQEQAVFLDSLLGEQGKALRMAIYLDISNDLATQRALNRSVSIHQHDDVRRVQHRHQRFHRKADRLLEYLGDSRRLTSMNVSGPLDEAQANLSSLLEQIQNGTIEPAGEPLIDHLRRRAKIHQPHAEPVGATKDFVLLGGPGSGKGTQAQFLTETYSIPHISTGDLFRRNIKDETQMGKLASKYIGGGDLVPDDITESMVLERLKREDTKEGFLLDGYPRSLAQAEALEEILIDLKRELSAAIYLRVSDEEIVARLSGRLICKNCGAIYHTKFKAPKKEHICDNCGSELYQRPDDKPDAIRNRLRTFHRLNKPLLAHYAQAGLLRVVEGEGTMEQVNARMKRAADPGP